LLIPYRGLLKRAKIEDDGVMAETLAANFDVFEALDCLIRQSEARFNADLRELDRRKATIARNLMKEQTEDIMDIEVDVGANEEVC
jgi:hypothetical protein